jgi:hypothetical protein
MPRARYPHRIWLYLILAAAMLAAPLLQYTDSGERLGALAAGAVVLTLIAYGEIFASVRRGTRILRAMHGQRDLMFLAEVNPNTARRDIWRDLWQNGGWVALGALWVGRFAMAYALAQYFHLYHFWVPDGPLAHPFEQVAHHLRFISHNGPYEHIPLLQPIWWQRVTAALVLLVLLLAESRMMLAVGMTVYLRQRHMQRWVIPSAVGARVVMFAFALLVISGLTIIITSLSPNLTAKCSTMDGSDNLKLAWHLNDAERDQCHQGRLHVYASKAVGGAQVGLMSFGDGGILAAADIMRVTRIRYSGTGFDHQVYSRSGNYYYWGPWNKSALLSTLQMAGGAGVAALIMTAIAQTLFLRITRRYGNPPS